MLWLLPALSLLSCHLQSLVSANCPSCDSYNAALQSCQTTNVNVTALGSKIDTATIHCMCTSKSSLVEMSACQGCEDADSRTTLLYSVLGAWTLTCTADGAFGDEQAASCWESQPDNVGPCYSRTGASDNTDGGDTISPTSSQPSSASPTATAESDAILFLQAPVLHMALVVGFGMLMEL